MTLNAPDASTSNADRSPARWALPLLLIVVTGVAFHRGLYSEFVNLDDIAMLVDNRDFRGFGSAQLRWMFTTFLTGPYQPLSWLSYAVDHAIWGMRPFGYHLTNLLLHTATVVAFYFVAQQLLRIGFDPLVPPDSIRLASAAAALLFGIHPLRVESVVWATERRDVLSGLLYMVTALAYLRYVRAGTRRRTWYLLTLGLFILCLLAKSMAVTLPIALLIIDVYPLQRLGLPWGWLRGPGRGVLIEKIPFLAVSLALGIIAVIGQHSSGAMADVEQIPLGWRIGIATYAAGFYVVKTILPIGLAPMYEFTKPFEQWLAYMAGAAVLLLMISVMSFAMRRRWPALAAAWVFYLVTLAPVSGLLQAGVQIAADRYSYLPMLGFNLLVGAAIVAMLRSASDLDRRRSRIGLAVICASVLAIFVGLTVRQTEFWRDSERVWKRVIDVDRRSPMGHANLGILYHLRGQNAAALPYAMAGALAKPNHSDVQLVCARVLRELGRQDEANEFFRRAATVQQPSAEAQGEYGLLLARSGDYAGAERFLLETVRLKPTHAEAQATLGLIAASRGDLNAAKLRFDQSLNAPDIPPYLYITIARAWQRFNRADEALSALQRGLVKHPVNVELQQELRMLSAVAPASQPVR